MEFKIIFQLLALLFVVTSGPIVIVLLASKKGNL